MFSNEGNQRHSLASSILQLISVQMLLLTLSVDCQSYSNYGVPYITSAIDRLFSMYPPPPPPPTSYGSSYGPAVYGIQSSRPNYQPNYSPAPYQPNYSPALSTCLSYYCYRSALPLTAGSTTTVAPPPPPTTQGPCGNRNFLVCVADNLASNALTVASSPYQQYPAYQKYNVCPAYFCRVVTTTTPAPPATAAPDACDSFECEIVEWASAYVNANCCIKMLLW